MKSIVIVSAALRIITGSRFVSGYVSCLRRLVLPLCALGIFTLTAPADQMTGELSFTGSNGVETPTYQSGDKVYVGLKDTDRNLDAGVVEEVRVRVTSQSEDTGGGFSASSPVAGHSDRADSMA